MRIAAYIGYIGKVSSNVRAEYKKRTQQRQTVVFGSIIAIMAVLLVLGTLTWSGLLPFPFEREFSKAPIPTQLCARSMGLGMWTQPLSPLRSLTRVTDLAGRQRGDVVVHGWRRCFRDGELGGR
ncbi:hypothetical protein [Trueperella pyogenes]|uniref:hypothetical protein n=1 Tax=Trueperella pyogenes TaxID=1661 RepID=UPI0011C04D89|nr:hypothetical protein [Trueperella pyogenes]